MKISHLLEADKQESGPSGFETIKRLGNQTFSNRKFEVKVALNDQGFEKVIAVIPDASDDELSDYVVDYDIENVANDKEAIKQSFAEYKQEDQFKYTTTSARGIEKEKTVNITASDVQVSAIDVSDTAPDQIKSQLYGTTGDVETIKKIAGAETITIANIRQLVKTGDDRQEALTTILDNFIDGKVNFPVTVLNDASVLTDKYGFEKTVDIINDFAEVLAPVGLLTDNLAGNGQRLIVDFLGAKNTNQLRDGATMHFQPGRNYPLVDSYIEYNGRVVSISSKSNGGAAAKFKGFANSMAEIRNNSTANDKFEELLRSNNRFKRAFAVLEILMGSVDDETVKTGNEVDVISAGSKSMIQYVADSKQMMDLIGMKNVGITDRDLSLFERFIKDNNVAKKDDWNNKYRKVKKVDDETGDEYEDQELISTSAINTKFKAMIDRFSPEFRNLFVYYRSPKNSMGRSFTDGKFNDKYDMYRTLKQACAFHISRALNADQAYSDLATWIFNHSAIIQVNFATSRGVNKKGYTGNGSMSQSSEGDKKPLVFYNMIATWPATSVDTVVFTWGASEEDVHNKLYTNGHDTMYPAKDKYDTDADGKKLSANKVKSIDELLNKSDPVVDSMIEQRGLDVNDPSDRAEIEKIQASVSNKRSIQSQDLSKTPDDWASQGVFKSNTLNKPLSKSGSSSSTFVLSPGEAYKIAATGYTDSELQDYIDSGVKFGKKPSDLKDFITTVRTARYEIMKFVLARHTDAAINQKYNDLVQNDLTGRTNPNKRVTFKEDEYDTTASQRQAYDIMLDPNVTKRTDTLIVQGIRNFERLRERDPNRFAQLVTDVNNSVPAKKKLVDRGQSQRSGTLNKIADKLDAKKKLQRILNSPEVSKLFNEKIPHQEKSHVYNELIDMVAHGADEGYVISQITNWQQNELATVGNTQPAKQSPVVQQSRTGRSVNGQVRYKNVYNSLIKNPEFIRLWASLGGDKQSFIQMMIEIFDNTSFLSLNSDVTELMSQLRDELGVRESRSHILQGILG